MRKDERNYKQIYDTERKKQVKKHGVFKLCHAIPNKQNYSNKDLYKH